MFHQSERIKEIPDISVAVLEDYCLEPIKNLKIKIDHLKRIDRSRYSERDRLLDYTKPKKELIQ